ncbi:hypothetical protein SUGI_1019350 [Cryptomeria japonica]|nr:hypothetical protein SUGI_1019350 [Cryptomeria japonica]
MSTRPCFCMAKSTAALTSSSLLTSQWMKVADGDRDSASFSPASSEMSAIMTLAPCFVKSRTLASPMPDDPPVIIAATLPSNLHFISY